jgi:DNA (cytosine-5)-methyltransferase 1
MNENGQRARSVTAIDLFAGCGGLTQGLKQGGFKVLGAVEIDPNATEVYRLNHPEVSVFEGDIRNLKAKKVLKELRLKKGDLGLLAGCPPCQGFSKMRTLNGARVVRDSRNGLLTEFLRFVEQLRPKAIMMENVPGLASNRRFKRFKSRLKELGYLGKDDILDAANYGVPQRRNRLIYIAALGHPVKFGKPTKRRKTVRDAITGLRSSGKSGDAIHDMPERRSAKVVRLIKSIPKNGGSRQDLPRHRQLECHKNCDGFKDVYGRMAWGKLAPTITSGCFNPSKGRFLHPSRNRTITMREAALLQGFPEKYKFSSAHGKVIVAMLIGNALPPPFIACHARSLKRTLLQMTV